MEIELDEIQNRVIYLKHLLSNLKKNPNHRYLKITLEKKLVSLKTTYTDIIHKLSLIEENISETQLKFFTNLTRSLYNETYELINQKLVYYIHYPNRLRVISYAIIFCAKLSKIHKGKMASVIEIIKVISSLVPTYDGKPDKISNVISSLNACKALVTDENKSVAIQTILSRLEGKARAAVPENPASVDEIIIKLKEKCLSTISPTTLIAKLNATVQTDSFLKFTENIEKLTLDLERAYISENVPLDTATKLASSAGIKALQTGIKDNDTKLLLKVGQFDSLTKAIEKASESEAENQIKKTSILTYQNRNFNNYRSFNNRNFNAPRIGRIYPQYDQQPNNYRQQYNQQPNNNRQQYNQQPNNNRQQYNQQPNNYRQQYNRQPNNYRPQYNRQQNNQQPNNFRQQNQRFQEPNIYCLAPENQLAPQQEPVGGQNNMQIQNVTHQEQQQPQISFTNPQQHGH